MKLLVRFHGGVGCDRRNSMSLLVRSHGGVIFDGRNSMNLFGKVSWWCRSVYN